MDESFGIVCDLSNECRIELERLFRRCLFVALAKISIDPRHMSGGFRRTGNRAARSALMRLQAAAANAFGFPFMPFHRLVALHAKLGRAREEGMTKRTAKYELHRLGKAMPCRPIQRDEIHLLVRGGREGCPRRQTFERR